MKTKRLTPAKLPLPKFRTDEEAADYFESHSIANVLDQLPDEAPIKLTPALSKQIRERHARNKAPISIRLEPDQIAAAKKIANAKSLGYQTQLRLWISEGIRREAKPG